jgi:alanyl aminopeptidase
MTRLTPVLTAAALACGWTLTPSAEAARLGRDVVPTFQAVELEVDANQSDYRGAVRIALRVETPTDHFSLHARDMEILSLTLEGPSGPVEIEHGQDGEDMISLHAPTPLPAGDYTLTIAFESPFNTRAVALYRVEEDGHAYAFTQFEAADARGAFPCFDEPGFKIPWQLTVKVPEGHIAVSNTPVQSRSADDGWTTYVFAKSKPLPSYLIALATGPLDTVEMPGLGVPARIVTTRGQTGLSTLAIEQTPPILRALERYFGEPYPYEKLDFIAISEYWAGAMENPGAVTFSSDILLLDPASASVAERRRLAKVIAHELAHMWFGDKVTMEWWNDLWLNESFADWMGDKITGEVFPQYRMDLEVVDDTQSVMIGDARPTTSPVRRPVESTDTLLADVGLQYNKGKAILGMFEAWVGEDVFRSGVLAYMDANAWGNATADDLWTALDEASPVGLGRAVSMFIDQPGLPLVDVEPLGQGRVRLAQSRFGTGGAAPAPQTWLIPVALKYSANGEAVTREVLLGEKATVVDLGADPDWIYPKAGARGYYRWRVPDQTLSSLTTLARTRLSDAERMDLVGNLAGLMRAGVLDGGHLLAAFERLGGDPEPMVVSSVLDQLGTLEDAFASEDLEDEFAAYVRRTLRPALDRIGLAPREGEGETTTVVRPRLLAWLGETGRDPEVMSFAEAQARAYLERSSSVPPSMASTCLALATLDEGEEHFELLRRRFEKAGTPAERTLYLGLLGWFHDPALVDRALDYSFSGPLRPDELFVIPGTVARRADGRAHAWRWMTEHYSDLGERFPPEFMGFMPFMARGCSAERLESARAFFAQPEHQVPGTTHTLSRVESQVDECLALRAREGGTVRTFLEKTAP